MSKIKLIDKITAEKQPTALVDFPSYDKDGYSVGKILLKTMSHTDNLEVERLIITELASIFGDKVDLNSYVYIQTHKNIQAKHWVYRFCYDPETNERVFESTDQVSDVLSNDQVSVLFTHYLTLLADSGQYVAYMSDKEFEEYIGRLAQSAEESPYFLDILLPEAKNAFLMYMARQLWNLQTGKSQPGTPVKESTTSSNPSPSK